MLQTKVLLSERLAHRLIWNRSVNNNGQLDSNLPNDLDIEHCNKVFKDEAHSYRGVFTDKVVSRVSRSAMKTDMVLKNYGKVSKVARPSGRHTPGDVTCDIVTLVQQFKARNLFGYVSGRRHSAFREFKLDQLSLDMNDFRDWLSRSMKKIAKKKKKTFLQVMSILETAYHCQHWSCVIQHSVNYALHDKAVSL